MRRFNLDQILDDTSVQFYAWHHISFKQIRGFFSNHPFLFFSAITIFNMSAMNSEGHNKSGCQSHGSYLECTTRLFFTGLSTFSIVFAGTFFAQLSLHSRQSYPKQRTIIISAAAAALVSYYVTSRRMSTCKKS